MTETHTQNYINLTADIVSAYVSKNSVPASDLPTLIGQVHSAIISVANGANLDSIPAEPLKPAVPIKKSVTQDFIICLEDGKKFKSLRRHLNSAYNMTPDEYREKWGLGHDYPMVAPAYAEKRSNLAKDMGLGQKRRAAANA